MLNFRVDSRAVTGLCFDAPHPWQVNFQDPATPAMEGIVDLHHDVMFFMVAIVIFVLYLLCRFVYLFNSKWVLAEDRSNIVHNTYLEIFWTVVPTALLIWIAIPSFALLYAMDECLAPSLTFKVIGNQWY